MQTFSSEKHSIPASASTLTAYLSRPENLREILPADRVENWKSEGDHCSFKIKGLADIALRLDQSTAENVTYVSATNKPFAFTLVLNITSTTEGQSTLSAHFEADVNSFMGMMLKTPLKNFLDSLGTALKIKYEGV